MCFDYKNVTKLRVGIMLSNASNNNLIECCCAQKLNQWGVEFTYQT